LDVSRPRNVPTLSLGTLLNPPQTDRAHTN
jgi:hypothetical protein